MRYAVLTVRSWYAEDFPEDTILSSDINTTLLEFTHKYHRLFHQTYSGEQPFMRCYGVSRFTTIDFIRGSRLLPKSLLDTSGTVD